MALISCKNVSMGYEGRVVLEEVDFKVEAGDYLCIAGENGSGKSTLMKGLLKLKLPIKGEIQFGDGLSSKEIGYLPQRMELQKNFPASVYEVVLSGRINQLKWRPFYSSEDKKTALHNMELTGIRHLKGSSFHELSGGQQQRVLIARALCATKKLLLLDEPITGLDPVVTSEIYELVKTINREHGITVLMISHDLRMAVQYTSKLLLLGNRQLFFGDTTAFIRSEYGRLFLGGEGNA